MPSQVLKKDNVIQTTYIFRNAFFMISALYCSPKKSARSLQNLQNIASETIVMATMAQPLTLTHLGETGPATVVSMLQWTSVQAARRRLRTVPSAAKVQQTYIVHCTCTYIRHTLYIHCTLYIHTLYIHCTYIVHTCTCNKHTLYNVHTYIVHTYIHCTYIVHCTAHRPIVQIRRMKIILLSPFFYVLLWPVIARVSF